MNRPSIRSRCRPVALAGLLFSCVTTPPPATPATDATERTVPFGKGAVVLSFDAIDAQVADVVARAIEQAWPVVSRWGELEVPVRLRIHPTHDALEAAVRRFDYPWLRAWARYDTIDLQSPRTWSLVGAPQASVTELLTHELTHCLMYQRAGTASDWMFKGIPLWFREGMASVTARQGYRRFTDEEVWRWLRSNPDKDPVLDAEGLYQTEERVVYGAAHRAFDFLARRYGDDAVRSIMDVMRGGTGFGVAFRRVVGIREAAFASEYVRYVRWEGWRDTVGEPGVLVPVGVIPGAAQ